MFSFKKIFIFAFSLTFIPKTATDVHGSYSRSISEDKEPTKPLLHPQKGSKEEYLQGINKNLKFKEAKERIKKYTKYEFNLDEFVRKFSIQEILASGSEMDFTRHLCSAWKIHPDTSKIIHPVAVDYFNLFYKEQYEAPEEDEDSDVESTNALSSTRKDSGSSEEYTSSGASSGAGTPTKRKSSGKDS